MGPELAEVLYVVEAEFCSLWQKELFEVLSGEDQVEKLDKSLSIF